MIEMNVDSIVDMLEYENDDYLEDIDDLGSFDEWISKWEYIDDLESFEEWISKWDEYDEDDGVL